MPMVGGFWADAVVLPPLWVESGCSRRRPPTAGAGGGCENVVAASCCARISQERPSRRAAVPNALPPPFIGPRPEKVGGDVVARSPLPTGFAQAVEHVFVVFGAHQVLVVTNIGIEIAWGNGGECRTPFLGAAKLPQGGCEPGI
jgi:hypothetical protein